MANKKIEGIGGRERHDSIGCLEEEKWKKKRKEMDKSGEDQDNIFKRSKMTERSPQKGEKEKEVEEWIKEMGKGIEIKMERLMKEMKDSFMKKQEEMMKETMKEMIKEMKKEVEEKWKEWREERENMKKNINELKERVENLEQRGEKKEGERKNEDNNKIIEKMMKIERRMELKEKEERRKNVVIKGLEVREGKRREATEEILRGIEAKVGIKEVRRIGMGNGGKNGREMVLVKLENEDQKWEVMEKKKILKGRIERITEDLTWKERKTRWRLVEIARNEETKGNKTWIKGGKIKIGGQW